MAKTDIVIIELDRPRELRFGFKALKVIEGTFKKSLMEIVGEGLNKLKSNDIERILYAGLKEDDNDLEFDKVEELLNKTSYFNLITKMTDAIYKAYGVEETKEDDNERFKKPEVEDDKKK
jgi:hypothetical protein